MSRPSVQEAAAALRRANAPFRGHKLQEVVEWFDNDDSSGYVECSCGWRSRSVKTCWLRKLGDEHLLIEVG